MNRKLAKMEQRKKALVAHSKSILDAAEKDGRELTAQEQTLFDCNKRELVIVATEIDAEVERCGYQDNPTIGGFDGDDYPGKLDDDFSAQNENRPLVKGRIGARYSDLFAGSGRGSKMSSRDFFGALASGTFHPGLAALNEGSGSTGGWIVPDQVVTDYFGVAYENSIVWPRATVFPMTGETLKIPGFDASTAADGTLFGGQTWAWLSEEGTGTVSNPLFRKVEMHARKLAIFSTASNELAEDGLDLQTQLERAMQVGSGWALDYSFLRGSGAGMPLGVLNDPALVAVAKEAGQEADSIVYENLIKMLSRCHQACFGNSIWIANPTCIPSLLTLCAPAGLGGQPLPVLRESNGAWNLLTRPMLFSEKLPAIGDQGDLLLVDLSQYAIALRRELTIERSQHIRFMSDESVWRGIVRCDGQGLWNAAYTPHTGDTQSWCVVLEAR